MEELGDLSESDQEGLRESLGFRRGARITMSLGRSFKAKEFESSNSTSTLYRAGSVASSFSKSGRNSGFFEKFFGSKSRKEKHKDEIAQLQTELAYQKTQAQNDKAELEHLRKENARMDKDSLLKDRLSIFDQENQNLKRNNEDLKTCEKRIISTVSQVLKTYGEKMAFLDCEILHHSGNLQVGSGNTQVQNVSSIDMEGLDTLFAQYHEKLENVTREWNQTLQNLQVTKIMQDQLNQRVLALEDTQKEMTEALNDAKSSKKQEISTELDYTISLTDPTLMAVCVEELQRLPKRCEKYKFTDLEGNAKVGVLRVYKKYVKIMNLKRFVQRLELEEVVGEEVTADVPLQKDDCASLLVKWAHLRKENDAEALLERFPRIQPGSDPRRGKMFSYNACSSESLYSNEERLYRTEFLREGLVKEIKQTVQHEINVQLTPQLEEIKNKLDEKVPQFV